jgi:hypothetical protein
MPQLKVSPALTLPVGELVVEKVTPPKYTGKVTIAGEPLENQEYLFPAASKASKRIPYVPEASVGIVIVPE